MQSKVVVVPDATTGAVIYVSANNPDYGYVKLQQVRTLVDDNGFLRRQNMSALIQAPVGILQEMGYYAGQILDGKIIIKESLAPFNKKSPERDLKIAGKTGILCKVGDEPIYRKTVYNTSSNAADITIQHDNVEELREAYAVQRVSTTTVRANEDFTI